jgi:hypothetical protein
MSDPSDDLTQQLARVLARWLYPGDLWSDLSAETRDLETDGMEGAARAVLASGLVVPTSAVNAVLDEHWGDHTHPTGDPAGPGAR